MLRTGQAVRLIQSGCLSRVHESVRDNGKEAVFDMSSRRESEPGRWGEVGGCVT